MVGDGLLVEEGEAVGEGGVDVLDLAGGGVGPALGLAALVVDARLCGLKNLFIDALLEVELDELALFSDQFPEAALVAGGLASWTSPGSDHFLT